MKIGWSYRQGFRVGQVNVDELVVAKPSQDYSIVRRHEQGETYNVNTLGIALALPFFFSD